MAGGGFGSRVESVIRGFPNSLCPTVKNLWQDTRGCKRSFLKARKGNYKRWNLEAEKACFSLLVLLKPTLTYGKGRTR
jgi:hypothetical protein